ncbi:MAG: hypothetical protein AUJ92_11530 [Armatimonadetes bacterium CG2_30_59_28]|nr:hypothetical protein [Armatimonadota bacterium]OIO93832.1 MAG: hypothetical protein AUJ92_11530 [Armatimonadetes bacterium CG2_30_59_28]PIU65166.1 MAG: hypothetical protein COS85_09840 [Armatimonadetes bacterium CG07_land_8_20_14_0_80_59_28]PIX38751.1 MAG: hypothetical protein COZ56_19680 [Armatimonadetes bacterium CG_4_8_14_3_um_filter_58_9]PIY41237.1 MAG: hypothetical protein COZ05_16025 [Armatimonadetes bacterium CG_4_10_14_3_um_filter_59_10]PJB78618.1 MAG: hypothetical protein CO095_003
MSDEIIQLKDLKPEEIPDCLKAEFYFDFKAHPFAHEALFSRSDNVVDVLGETHKYIVGWLEEFLAANSEGKETCEDAVPGCPQAVGRFKVILEEGAVFAPSAIIGVTKPDKRAHTVYVSKDVCVFGSVIYVSDGDIVIGEGTTVEPGAAIKGPAIIGKKNDIRQGAYFRGDIITGDGCTFRGEIKNGVMMDKANFPHPSYVGDSLCGYMTHFGNQATSANLGIFEGMRDTNKRQNIRLQVDGKSYDTGRVKIGIIMGDFSQVGCNSVTDPGSFIGPYTLSYALTRFTKGLYGPHEILKNKPLEHGVVERAKFRIEDM